MNIINRREQAAINILRFTLGQWFGALGFVIGWYSVGINYRHYSLLIWLVGFVTLAVACHGAWEYSFISLNFSLAYHTLISLAGLAGTGYHTLWAWRNYEEILDRVKNHENHQHDPKLQTIQYSIPLSYIILIGYLGSLYFTWALRKQMKSMPAADLKASLNQEYEAYGSKFDPMKLCPS